ncbi:hypothetical protein FRD01_13155 [Microvenator marinus]|uniref:DUF7151 domain-containing protein n=1 Tax=Microvenator marinus TaxID=2600177 RepID=A0A5B8XSC0_9DELT|nr:hypothetical protein [Microvenator marinus]QED28161.1 hypothetical protein FRD01_13155 [Microvenator marinus]
MKHTPKMLSLITLLLCAACGGADGQDGQDRQNGADGQSTLFRTTPIEPGDTCPTGGSLIEFGVDTSQDGILGDEEVAESTTVCNGTDGTPGSDGTPGEDGSPGADGQDGAPGADGLTTLINITPEQAGANCVAGGQLIEAGADTDGSGTLEPTEVTSSAYICNGEEGMQGPPGQDGAPGQDGQDGADLLLEVINEPPGANCQFGGQRLIAGIDDNQDGALDTAEIDQSLYVCDSGLLLSEPAVSTVFDNHEQCYVFTNNLISTVWDNVSNQLLSGDFARNGYWKFAPGTSDWAASPDQDTATAWGRFVLVAGPRQIVGAPGSYVGHPASSYYVADIDATGTLSNQRSAIFSDGFTGSCHQISTSNDEFLCYDGAGVRHYTVVSGSANLTLNKVVPLSQQPVEINTFGTTFAWDGAYYYFAQDGRTSTSKNYLAYGSNGQIQGTYTVAGSGAINSPYFDWSVRRYSTHDGFGNRQEGTVYLGATVNSGSWDSHCFGPPSPYHVAP